MFGHASAVERQLEALLARLPCASSRYTRKIQLYLGHRNIQHTTRSTALATDLFMSSRRD
jgi:hypothetical protein